MIYYYILLLLELRYDLLLLDELEAVGIELRISVGLEVFLTDELVEPGLSQGSEKSSATMFLFVNDWLPLEFQGHIKRFGRRFRVVLI